MALWQKASIFVGLMYGLSPMTAIANATVRALPSLHFSARRWEQLTRQISTVFKQHAVHPAHCVVLLPYAQLIPEARTAWAASLQSHRELSPFLPRFETTITWAASVQAGLGPPTFAGDDLRMDTAFDWLSAASLLERAGLGMQKEVLAGRLVEAAWSIARSASAIEPIHRTAWGLRLGAELTTGLDAPVLALEAAVSRIALAWAAASSYPTDVLFSQQTDLLMVLESLQTDPLTEALKARWGGRAMCWSLNIAAPRGQLALHAAQDAEDEAHRGAACVLAQLAKGNRPVALIAQDRALTRRIRALLGERGIAIRDETGWKLSTTRAAASLMLLLRAARRDASADSVLDWLKNAPAFDASSLAAAEIEMRRAGLRQWRDVPSKLVAARALFEQVQPLRASLQRSLPLTRWLGSFRSALQAAGQWNALELDAAGRAVLEALRLHPGQEAEFERELAHASPSMRLRDFTGWVSQVLEAANFVPEHPSQTQVVIMPLGHLLGRPLQAVVLPGADEMRLPVSPEPPGFWSPAQRNLLGLASREELMHTARAVWSYALQFEQLDVLWRRSDAGEQLMASGFVQELLLEPEHVLAADPRQLRALQAQPTPAPMPSGAALPMTRLSASAYEDLRQCPYRFFALRQLKLTASDELEEALHKRDFGNWLHSLLRHFHEALAQAASSGASEGSAHGQEAATAQKLKKNEAIAPVEHDKVAMINIAAERATRELGLSESEFLPFAAAWPRVREGYLAWLAEHEAVGTRFIEAEQWKETPLGNLSLHGKIDRLDRLADGRRLVIDYKTEPSRKTAERIAAREEDTQLPFYAALLADDTLEAAYVNLGEKDLTQSYPQHDIVALRDELIAGIQTDMARIAGGAALPALGEGRACDYCAARGLCRKDFRPVA